MWSYRTTIFSLALLALENAAGCKRATDETHAQPVEVSSTPVTERPEEAVRKKHLAELKAPPLTPPRDTVEGPSGIRWRAVTPGTGRPPGSEDQVREEVSVWKSDGKLVFSTLQTSGTYSFTAKGLAEPFLNELQKMNVGSVVQVWIPKATVAAAMSRGGVSNVLPVDDLILEGEIVALEEPPPTRVIETGSSAMTSSPTDGGARRPDAAGPPKEASTTASGLKFVRLSDGTGTKKPTKDSRVHLLLTAWPVKGLVVREPSLRDYTSVITPGRAPKSLSSLISTMVEGETRRVWLTPELGKEIASTDGSAEVVLDLTLQTIE